MRSKQPLYIMTVMFGTLCMAVVFFASSGCRDATRTLGVQVASLVPAAGMTTVSDASGGHGSAGSGAFRFDPLEESATCRSTNSPNYVPFDLPDGFTQRIIATQHADFTPVAGSGGDLPDMLTLNETGPHAGRFLYRTHEVGRNGAVTMTDLVTGVTSLVVQEPHFELLDGIAWTPWGTLLFAEEITTARSRDPRVPHAVRGLVYEYDPRTGITVPRPALGARPHEGMRVDPNGNVYGLSESRGRTRPGQPGQSGAVFKFVPDKRGDLSTGDLYALKVDDASSKTGTARWMLLDRAAVEVDSDAEAMRVGATAWERPEDIEIATSTGNNRGGANVMYVSMTGDNLVIRVELKGDDAFVSNYVKGGVNVPDGQGLPDRTPGFDDPDNLALDSYGNLFIAEDEGPGDIWVAEAGSGRELVAKSVVLFASLGDCSAEPTGIYFDKSGKTLWVNVQHAGGNSNDLTVEITRSKPTNDPQGGGKKGDGGAPASGDVQPADGGGVHQN